MKRLLSVALAVSCLSLVLLICEAKAQDVTASIAGTIADQSGSAVAGAKITANSVERGITYIAASNETGLYRISQLTAGNYELRVQKQSKRMKDSREESCPL
jgi:hypothetical protein